MAIDLHNHFIPSHYLKEVEKGRFQGVTIRWEGDVVYLSYEQEGRKPFVIHGDRGMYDVEAKLQAMDEQGIELAVLSVPPPLFHYRESAQLQIDAARSLNDGLAQMAAENPRFAALGTLPLGASMEAALKEFERIMDAGMVGVEIGTNVRGVSVGDPAFHDLYALAQEKGAVIFLHGYEVFGGERLGDFHLRNLVGNPAEAGMCGAQLIFHQVPDKYPNCKIVMPHAGGILPYIADRMDHGYEVRPECKHLPKPPSAYLDWFWYDTIAHGPATLKFVIDRVGADRVVVGSDHPFDMADFDPVKSVRQLGLPADKEAAILTENAKRLLGRS